MAALTVLKPRAVGPLGLLRLRRLGVRAIVTLHTLVSLYATVSLIALHTLVAFNALVTLIAGISLLTGGALTASFTGSTCFTWRSRHRNRCRGHDNGRLRFIAAGQAR
jgi:hypothetical protein